VAFSNGANKPPDLSEGVDFDIDHALNDNNREQSVDT
jgi:hypothetical protein